MKETLEERRMKDPVFIQKVKEEARRRVVSVMKEITETSGDLQINHTPPDICREMLDKVDLEKAENVLVLFNIELLYELRLRGYSGEVYYFTQSQKEVDFAKKLIPDVKLKYIDKEEDPFEFMNTWPEKFDVIVANPPYSKNLHLKFLDKCVDLGKEEIIFVHPSTQYVEGKGSNKTYADHLDKISDNIKSLEFFNGNQAFNIALFVPCCITHIDKSKKYKEFELINKMYGANQILPKDSIKDLSIWGHSEELISIKNKVLEILGKNGNLHEFGNVLGSRQEHKRKVSDEDMWIVEITHIRGNISMSSDMGMVKDDFFTLTRIDNEPKKGIDPKYNIWWEFKTEEEARNFISYIKTDFARMCLALVKVNQNLYNGELKFIPVVDFSKKWTDSELYDHFNITEREQAFIKEVIKPYYN